MLLLQIIIITIYFLLYSHIQDISNIEEHIIIDVIKNVSIMYYDVARVYAHRGVEMVQVFAGAVTRG